MPHFVVSRRYLKDPGFPLRDPRRFAEGLMERYAQAISSTGGGTSPASSETALVLSAAAVELLRAHPALSDHVVGLGYGAQLLSRLRQLILVGGGRSGSAGGTGGTGSTAVAPTGGSTEPLGGSVLRLLHQISASPGAAERLSTVPPPDAAVRLP